MVSRVGVFYNLKAGPTFCFTCEQANVLVVSKTTDERPYVTRVFLIAIGCLVYSQLMIGVDSIANSTGRYERVILLEQLVWLTPLGVLLFCWTFDEFRRCDVHLYRMLLLVVLVCVFALVLWPLRHLGISIL